MHAGAGRVDDVRRRTDEARPGDAGRPADREPLPPVRLEVTKNAVLVGTGSHPVQLGEVKAFGKKAMSAADWARGVQFPESATLGD